MSATEGGNTTTEQFDSEGMIDWGLDESTTESTAGTEGGQIRATMNGFDL